MLVRKLLLLTLLRRGPEFDLNMGELLSSRARLFGPNRQAMTTHHIPHTIGQLNPTRK